MWYKGYNALEKAWKRSYKPPTPSRNLEEIINDFVRQQFVERLPISASSSIPSSFQYTYQAINSKELSSNFSKRTNHLSRVEQNASFTSQEHEGIVIQNPKAAEICRSRSGME
jgi:hypothetical protein